MFLSIKDFTDKSKLVVILISVGVLFYFKLVASFIPTIAPEPHTL